MILLPAAAEGWSMERWGRWQPKFQRFMDFSLHDIVVFETIQAALLLAMVLLAAQMLLVFSRAAFRLSRNSADTSMRSRPWLTVTARCCCCGCWRSARGRNERKRNQGAQQSILDQILTLFASLKARKFRQELQKCASHLHLLWFPDGWSGVEWSGMEWNGMEWNGMEWNGMEWNGMEWNGMEWNGMEWNGMEWTWNGMEWNGMEWNGMEWNGMEWNGMEWNGMEWNGMEWNGMEWNGMEWNKNEWNGMIEWNGMRMKWNGMEMEWNGIEWNGMERNG